MRHGGAPWREKTPPYQIYKHCNNSTIKTKAKASSLQNISPKALVSLLQYHHGQRRKL